MIRLRMRCPGRSVDLEGLVTCCISLPLSLPPTAAERGGDYVKVFQDFHLKIGASKGQNLAVTVLRVPSLLDSGLVRFVEAVCRLSTIPNNSTKPSP